MVRVGKIDMGSFLAEKKMVKKGYCGNKGLGLALDRIKVSQIVHDITTSETIL